MKEDVLAKYLLSRGVSTPPKPRPDAPIKSEKEKVVPSPYQKPPIETPAGSSAFHATLPPVLHCTETLSSSDDDEDDIVRPSKRVVRSPSIEPWM